MNLNGATILILGGSGLVGRAVARRLLTSAPQRLVLVSLTERDSEAALAALAPGAGATAAPRGWVDLRPANCAQWVVRAQEMVRQAADRRAVGGSGSDRDWLAVEPVEPVVPWRMVTWILRHEDAGERIKR